MSTSYHWDGDDLLYQVNPSNTSISTMELMVEKLARVDFASTGPGMTVIDRDWTGTTVDTHSITGYTAFEPSVISGGSRTAKTVGYRPLRRSAVAEVPLAILRYCGLPDDDAFPGSAL